MIRRRENVGAKITMSNRYVLQEPRMNVVDNDIPDCNELQSDDDRCAWNCEIRCDVGEDPD
jgi:hypothetical protein